MLGLCNLIALAFSHCKLLFHWYKKKPRDTKPHERGNEIKIFPWSNIISIMRILSKHCLKGWHHHPYRVKYTLQAHNHHYLLGNNWKNKLPQEAEHFIQAAGQAVTPMTIFLTMLAIIHAHAVQRGLSTSCLYGGFSCSRFSTAAKLYFQIQSKCGWPH